MKLIDAPNRGLFERYSERFGLTSTDENWLETFVSTAKAVRAGSQLALQGSEDTNAHYLSRGWAFTAFDHSDGSRTVFDIHLPGDLIVSPGIASRPRRATLYALSNCEICALDVEEIMSYARYSIGANNLMLHLLGSHHEALADRVIQTTRMPALTRISSFYVHLRQRLSEVSAEIEDKFYSPITQSLTAEILGMSDVHVSRTLNRLRALDVLHIRNRIVEFRDISRLELLSQLPDDFSVAV